VFLAPYRFAGKQKALALGIYPTVSLADARGARSAAKEQLAKGIDPSEARKLAKQALLRAAENSFEAIAREWHQHKRDALTPRYAGPGVGPTRSRRTACFKINRISSSDVVTISISSRYSRIESQRASSGERRILVYSMPTIVPSGLTQIASRDFIVVLDL
jgi:hypothetical protein